MGELVNQKLGDTACPARGASILVGPLGVLSVIASVLLLLITGIAPSTASSAPATPSPLEYSTRAVEEAYEHNVWPLGAATGVIQCKQDGYPCWQTFGGGGIYVRGLNQTPLVVSGSTFLKWQESGGMDGHAAGLPSDHMSCDADLNCQQTFQNADIYARGAGSAVIVSEDIWRTHISYSKQLGKPSADKSCDAGAVCIQIFESGVIYQRASGWPDATFGDIYAYYQTRASVLGGPRGVPVCSDAGCVQGFDRGRVYSSPGLGTYTMTGAIGAFHFSHSEFAGFGRPTSEEECGLAGGGCTQSFEAGRAYWAPVVGPSFIRGGIFSAWSTRGAERGPLGYPVFQENCYYGVCYQRFQSGGYLVWSPGAGTQLTAGAIGAKFERFVTYLGGPTTSTETCGLRYGGCFQQFASGKMYWAPGVGAWPIRGGMEAMWRSAGAESGSLGYPMSPEFCRVDGTGCQQIFQGGPLIWGAGLGEGGGYAP